MFRYRLAALLALVFSAASVATPSAQQFPVREQFPQLPQNPYCLKAACGYGRDGIVEPYTGGGLSGRSARAYAESSEQLFQSSHSELLSWVSSSDMAGTPQNSNDIWGYVSPRGREYAIVGLLTGTAFVEVTDPVEPRVVGFIPGAPSDWRDMAVYDRFAYSVNESGGGVQVIDLRRIDRGQVRLLGNFAPGGMRTAHNIYVNPDSGYAYVLGADIARGGLVALDLNNPRVPVLEPVAWDTAYVHDVLVVTYQKGRNKGREIAFAFTGPLGLHIIDITDKAAPVTLSHLRYANATYGHSGALSPNGRLLYVNDELDERLADGITEMTTYVVRVGDLLNPVLTRKIGWGIGAIDHNSMVQGNRLFMSGYTGGLRVIDIDRQRRPRALGFFDTHPETDQGLFRGAWGVFAGFPSGNVIVSDIARGLFVVRPE